MTIKRPGALCALLAVCGLSACMGNPSTQATSAIMGHSAISGVVNASRSAPSEADLAMSCPAIDQQLGRIYAETEEINRVERVRERKAGLLRGTLNAGASVIGAGAIASAGSAEAIANTGTAITVAGAAANAAVGHTGPDAQTLNRGMALQERAAVLERTKVKKGC